MAASVFRVEQIRSGIWGWIVGVATVVGASAGARRIRRLATWFWGDGDSGRKASRTRTRLYGPLHIEGICSTSRSALMYSRKRYLLLPFRACGLRLPK